MNSLVISGILNILTINDCGNYYTFIKSQKGGNILCKNLESDIYNYGISRNDKFYLVNGIMMPDNLKIFLYRIGLGILAIPSYVKLGD